MFNLPRDYRIQSESVMRYALGIRLTNILKVCIRCLVYGKMNPPIYYGSTTFREQIKNIY